jgi:hypothetical protein
VAGGVGAAGLLTGAVTGVMLLDAKSTIKKSCYPESKLPNGQIPCDPAGADAAHRAQGTLAPIATVGFALGGAGIAAAVAIFLAGDSKASAPGTATPTLAVGPGLATVGFRSAF